MPNDEFADIASQLEGILSELNQISDPTLRRRMLASMRLLMTEADRLAGQQGTVFNFLDAFGCCLLFFGSLTDLATFVTTWGARMWEDSRYFWVVLCKNRWFHIRQSLSLNFRQKIPLAETDAVSPCPLVNILPFTVRCDKCGKEYGYTPSDVLRFELEDVPDSFTPHPLFRDEATDSIVADQPSGNVGS